MENIDFYTLTLGKLLELNDITQLVVNEFIFSPNTRIGDLKGPELKCLFNEDNIEDIAKKYNREGRWSSEIIGTVKYDVRQRLDLYARSGGCIMHINKANVWVFTYNSVGCIKRENFDGAVKAIARNEVWSYLKQLRWFGKVRMLKYVLLRIQNL